MNKFIIVLGLMVAIVSCKINRSISDSDLKKLGVEWFGKEVKIERNTANSHALMMDMRKSSMDQPGNGLTYGIVDLNTGKLLYRESLINGSVSWKDDVTVQVKSKPGVSSIVNEQNEQMANYTINVSTLKKNYNQSTK